MVVVPSVPTPTVLPVQVLPLPVLVVWKDIMLPLLPVPLVSLNVRSVLKLTNVLPVMMTILVMVLNVTQKKIMIVVMVLGITMPLLP